MKKVLIPVMYFLLCTGLYSYSVVKVTEATAPDYATVERLQGLYVFIHSKPVNNYVVLGSISKGFAWSGKPSEMLNALVSKGKKEYSQADGIIFTSDAMDKADLIKFK